MLDWIKRIKAPPPNVQLVEDHPAPATEERLERLLVRLGSDKAASPESIVAAKSSTEVDSSTAIVGDPATPDSNARSDNGSGIDSSAVPVSSAAVEGSPAIDPGLMAEIAAAVESAVASDSSTTVESSPEIDPQLAAEISAAIDSLDSSPSITLSLSTGDNLPAEESLAAEDELEPEDASETSAILGTPAAAEIEDRVELAGSLLTTRRTAAPVVASQMRIIAVCSQKGGSGKTTIAGHLAVQAGLAGHGPAVLIDTDPQGSLAEWWRARKDDVPALAKVKLEELDDNLAELRSYGTSVAIIDTPPALTGSIEQVMAIADLIVIPARPSPHDLRAVGAKVAM
jgi:Mrp family chromosome partitioning ATPase